MGTRYFEANTIFAWGPRQSTFRDIPVPDDDPKNYVWYTKQGYSKPGFNSPNIPNEGESTGLSQPDETSKGEDSTNFDGSEQLTYQNLAVRAADAMGVVSTQLVVAAKAWTHSISLLDAFSGANLPVRPLATKVGEPGSAANKIYDALLPSMMYSTFAITNEGGAERPGLTLNSSWIGDGRLIEDDAEVLGSGVKFYGSGRHVWNRNDIAAAAKTKINKRGVIIVVFPQENFAGTPVNTECILGDVGLSLDNQLTPNYNCGHFQDDDENLGAVAGAIESGGQIVGLDMSILADSAFVQSLGLYARIKSGSKFSILMLAPGPAIATTTPITITSDGGAAQFATSVPVDALAGPVAKYAVLTFTGGEKAIVSAHTAAAATAIPVFPLAAAITDNDAATYDYHHNAAFAVNKTSITAHDWQQVLGKQGLRITSTPLADGSTPALTATVTTNVEDPATYTAA
jgi:hypothetical protein